MSIESLEGASVDEALAEVLRIVDARRRYWIRAQADLPTAGVAAARHETVQIYRLICEKFGLPLPDWL